MRGEGQARSLCDQGGDPLGNPRDGNRGGGGGGAPAAGAGEGEGLGGQGWGVSQGREGVVCQGDLLPRSLKVPKMGWCCLVVCGGSFFCQEKR